MLSKWQNFVTQIRLYSFVKINISVHNTFHNEIILTFYVWRKLFVLMRSVSFIAFGTNINRKLMITKCTFSNRQLQYDGRQTTTIRISVVWWQSANSDVSAVHATIKICHMVNDPSNAAVTDLAWLAKLLKLKWCGLQTIVVTNTWVTYVCIAASLGLMQRGRDVARCAKIKSLQVARYRRNAAWPLVQDANKVNVDCS